MGWSICPISRETGSSTRTEWCSPLLSSPCLSLPPPPFPSPPPPSPFSPPPPWRFPPATLPPTLSGSAETKKVALSNFCSQIPSSLYRPLLSSLFSLVPQQGCHHLDSQVGSDHLCRRHP